MAKDIRWAAVGCNDVINNFIGLAGRPALTFICVNVLCAAEQTMNVFLCCSFFFFFFSHTQRTNQSKTVCIVAPSLAQQRDMYLDFLLCSKIKNIGRARSDLGKGL